jgi:uncharacterized membrane protein YgdD (TMEM256/DUF423 family)
MSFRVWLFIAGLSALVAVLAAAHGAHALGTLTTLTGATRAYEIAQIFHLAHAVALFGIATLFAATDGRRYVWGSVMLHLAGLGFLAGMVLFSGGIYYQVLKSVQLGSGIIPAGGMSFMAGWGTLALSVFGFRRAVR